MIGNIARNPLWWFREISCLQKWPVRNVLPSRPGTMLKENRQADQNAYFAVSRKCSSCQGTDIQALSKLHEMVSRHLCEAFHIWIGMCQPGNQLAKSMIGLFDGSRLVSQATSRQVTHHHLLHGWLDWRARRFFSGNPRLFCQFAPGGQQDRSGERRVGEEGRFRG